MATEEKWPVDKLDSANWMMWKFHMHHLLLAMGLCGWGSETFPEDPTCRVSKEGTESFFHVSTSIGYKYSAPVPDNLMCKTKGSMGHSTWSFRVQDTS